MPKVTDEYLTDKKVPEENRAALRQQFYTAITNNQDVPKEFKPHMLSGDYAGHMECHVENDFLLIWIDNEVVKLVRLGSHSELFGKKKK